MMEQRAVADEFGGGYGEQYEPNKYLMEQRAVADEFGGGYGEQYESIWYFK
ncbi:MAG: hypothetical protein WC974_08360 [Thermoplasmata archaeon]